MAGAELNEVRMTVWARVFAAVISALAWSGLLVQFFALFAENGSVMASLGIMLVYFTILTNLALAILFTGMALGWRGFDRPMAVAGTMLAIVLVGVVYHQLLRGLMELSGGAAVANVLLHLVTPAVVPVFWIMFVRKGMLRLVDPLLWAIYPLGYLMYALVWGGMHGRYPYPFLNVEQIGWGRMWLNAAVIAAGFMVAGWGVVVLDGWIGRRTAE
jgi:hypothetical protein